VGARTTQAGVDEKRGKCRIRFQYRGKQEAVVLDVPYTPAGIKAAAKLRAGVLREIAAGTFNPAEHFPEWRGLERIGGDAAPDASFEHYVNLFLAGKKKLAHHTWLGYDASARTHWKPAPFYARPIAHILHSTLTAYIGEHPFGSNKTLNNALIVLRGAFALARRDGLIDRDPCDGIENLQHQAKEADPLTQEEADKVIAVERERYGDAAADYREFAFYTGVRCGSEIIALQWGDVDFEQRTLTVQRANVRGTAKDTKTHRARVVDLNERAWATLQRQKARTFLAGKEIWLNENTGRPFPSDLIPRRRWTWALKKLGLRHRDAYQTRHCYATWLFNAYVPDKLIADQLGHSVPVLHKIYAKQIAGLRDPQRRERIDAALGFSPKVVPQEAASGAKS
jgi:integrase